ncbi:MAG: deoxyribose-phosphate aldolase [Erysipelotrichaceae bacterium]|nr:deoxyribose-phosphate aldolase [Erysipelotrichaceae bacterium]
MKKSKYIDHTLLKADATSEQIKKLCKEAVENDFKSVCVNSSYLKLCKKELEGTDILTCCVVGFPLGMMSTEAKIFETRYCIENGADEIDMVINVGRLKEGDDEYVYNEIKALKEVCGDKVLKVIIETCLLTDEEKVRVTKLIMKAKADFVKTSTGFSTGGATFEDVKLLADTVKGQIKIKVAGGVRTPEDFDRMIELGASRIGTSSGTKLIK